MEMHILICRMDFLKEQLVDIGTRSSQLVDLDVIIADPTCFCELLEDFELTIYSRLDFLNNHLLDCDVTVCTLLSL